jgi:hypothetical protein
MTVAATSGTVTGQQPLDEVEVLRARRVVLLLRRRREAVGREASKTSCRVVRHAGGDVLLHLHDRSAARRCWELAMPG